ncbi:amino acid ABC transporter permease [Nonomuraea sediminis]|uniref:amino acid ABC transporter permease n=1 Tax=Nonomuraea sediminis TaxID=2835864 RepID=UPI001BDDBBA7|nr:amino acid ABC transporter permease [Nonomuraea sediminis]
MTQQANSARRRPEPIKAVPVRHPWRWVTVGVLAVLASMFVNVLATNENFQWRFVFENVLFAPPVLEGLRGTVLLTVSSMLIGVALGVALAVMRLSASPVLRLVSWGYTWFFRAVPRLVLAVLFGNLGILWSRIGLGVPFDRELGALFGIADFHAQFWSIKATDLLTGFVAGMLALGLSEAAYMAEIVRAGIESVDNGQPEAAQALGLTRGQTLRRIVLPQAMQVIVPPTGNETIAMLKDTSLVAFTPVSMELFFQLQAISSRTYQVFPVLVAACLWYVVLSSALMVVQHFVERHFSRGYGTRARVRTRSPRRLSATQDTTVRSTA